MKKKHFAKIALVLAMIQLLVVCSVFSTSAAIDLGRPGKYGRSYQIYKTNATIAVDGTISEGEWDNLPWSQSFICAYDNTATGEGYAYRPEFDAKFKATWVDPDDTADPSGQVVILYLMIQIEGDTTVKTDGNFDAFQILIGDSNASGDSDSTLFRWWHGLHGLNTSITTNGTTTKNTEGNINTFTNIMGGGLSSSGTPTDKVGMVGGTIGTNKQLGGGTGGEWTKANYCYADLRDGNGDGKIVVEFQRKFDRRFITPDDGFGLDIMIRDGMGTSNYASYSWNGRGNTLDKYCALGSVTLVDSTYTDPLAGVSVTMTDGASIRLDTEGNTSGIRFATTVTVPEGVTIKETGTLIIPTESLRYRWCSITDSNFNGDVLRVVGTTYGTTTAPQSLAEGTNYYKIVNTDNEWIDGTCGGTGGTFYGTLYDIAEENYKRSISGVGYAVVEVGGVEYTVYAEHDNTVHARSIKDVAELALEAHVDPDHAFTATTEEYALLQKFAGLAS